MTSTVFKGCRKNTACTFVLGNDFLKGKHKVICLVFTAGEHCTKLRRPGLKRFW